MDEFLTYLARSKRPPTAEEIASHRGWWIVSAMPQGHRALFVVRFFVTHPHEAEIDGEVERVDGPLMRSLTSDGAVWRRVDAWGAEVSR